MPGKLCKGVPTDQPYIRHARAYCQGRTDARNGVLKAANPLTAIDADAAADWDRGHDSYAGGVGSPLPQDCCESPAFDGVV